MSKSPESTSSCVSERQEQLIQGLTQTPHEPGGRISKHEFCRLFPVAQEDASKLALGILECGLRRRDPSAIESGLIVTSVFGIVDAHLDVLLELALEDWHMGHEGIAMMLDRLRSPRAVETFHRLALKRFPYLDYDEAYALGVKCIWGLGNIGNEEAVERLGALLSCGNAVLEGNAEEQLTRIADEGASLGARDSARRFLEQGRVSRTDS